MHVRLVAFKDQIFYLSHPQQGVYIPYATLIDAENDKPDRLLGTIFSNEELAIAWNNYSNFEEEINYG